MYHVETQLSQREIDDRGEQVAIDHMKERAWLIAVRGTHPVRQLHLVNVAEQTPLVLGTRRWWFTFEAD
jgi:hypothetical protein